MRWLIAGALFIGVLIKRRRRTGYTLFKATGVKSEVTHVDLEQQQAIGVVTYKKRPYMTVKVDLKQDTITVTGSVEALGDMSMDEMDYIDLFKQEAKFFIDNHISDPQAYYGELIKQAADQ
ncbi:hypothetical protein [Planococcus sp. YIM B11945]|uniref:hypothetical protein n=1 Tax=Planococcus sp. YIM B11945 TaxID=3435410 RepID=UPI003D7C94A0